MMDHTAANSGSRPAVAGCCTRLDGSIPTHGRSVHISTCVSASARKCKHPLSRAADIYINNAVELKSKHQHQVMDVWSGLCVLTTLPIPVGQQKGRTFSDARVLQIIHRNRSGERWCCFIPTRRSIPWRHLAANGGDWSLLLQHTRRKHTCISVFGLIL